jgi:hypothetical protein
MRLSVNAQLQRCRLAQRLSAARQLLPKLRAAERQRVSRSAQGSRCAGDCSDLDSSCAHPDRESASPAGSQNPSCSALHDHERAVVDHHDSYNSEGAKAGRERRLRRQLPGLRRSCRTPFCLCWVNKNIAREGSVNITLPITSRLGTRRAAQRSQSLSDAQVASPLSSSRRA